MNIDRILVAASVPLLLGGCATNYMAEPGAAQFGEPNRQTYAAMIIDPEPAYEEPLVTSADKAAAATNRYRKDQVKQPERVDTTSVGGGGPGG